jgi:hypothetical protein
MQMERGAWKKPVIVEMFGRPGPVIISSTADAALMLIGAWPTKRTHIHIMAALTCRDVLAGRAEAGLARANFIEAAIEAGYRIQPETFLNERWEPISALLEVHRAPLGLVDRIRRKNSPSKEDLRAVTVDLPEVPPFFDLPPALVSPPAFERRESLRQLLRRLFRLIGLIAVETGIAALAMLGFRAADAPGRPLPGKQIAGS